MYAVEVARDTARDLTSLKSLGMQIAGVEHYDPKASSYTDLMKKAKAAGADAVFLAAILEENGAQLIKDKVSVLGDNSKVILMGPDGFNVTSTPTDAGSAAEGMYVTIGGQDPNQLTNAAGKAFAAAFKKAYKVKQLEAYTAYGAQAFQVLARSEGILCALESAHAVAALRKLPPRDFVVVNLSGRGDKDLGTILEALK